jgi:very-short-patch-repair endonuclease
MSKTALTPDEPKAGSSSPLPQGEGNERYREMASQAMVQIARDLRQRETNAEAVLWECLRNRRLSEIKFRRQHPIAGTIFVVDFLSYENRLIIELDGGIHEEQKVADAARQREIESLGYRFLRFRNEQILTDLESSLITILSTSFSPLPK